MTTPGVVGTGSCGHRGQNNLVPHPGLDRNLLSRLDLLVVNQHEAAAILGAAGLAPLDAARQLRALGPSTIVVTAGSQGAGYSHADNEAMVGTTAVPIVDTTGAGDAFLGALALSLATAMPLHAAVERAVQAGSQAVQHHGAQPRPPN